MTFRQPPRLRLSDVLVLPGGTVDSLPSLADLQQSLAAKGT